MYLVVGHAVAEYRVMADLMRAFESMSLPEQFQLAAAFIFCAFMAMLAIVFCGPSILAGARSLFPDETVEDLEDDEQRLAAAKRRARLELAARVPHQVDASSRRAILEAIAHMPHPTNRIH